MKPQNDIYYENLPIINRNILVAEPTEVFLEWAKRNPDTDLELTMDELLTDSTAYLIPEQEGDAQSWLRRNFKTIFEIELDGWCTDPSRWPADRSFKAFKKYFNVRFCSTVIDLAKGEIAREYL